MISAWVNRFRSFSRAKIWATRRSRRQSPRRGRPSWWRAATAFSPCARTVSPDSATRSPLRTGLAHDAGRIPGDNRPRRNGTGDSPPGPHDAPLANGYITKDHSAAADRGAAPYHGGPHRPVGFRLQFAARVNRPRIAVVSEDHVMPYEHLVFDSYAFADEGVAGDLAVPPALRPLLALDEGTDPRVVANLTAVEVDEVVDLHVSTQLHVRGDALVPRPLRHHLQTPVTTPRWSRECCAASSNCTTRNPAAPSVRGRRPVRMQSTKWRHTCSSASDWSIFGASMSPVRY